MRKWLVFGILALTSLGCGDGDDGPTSPSPLPQVAGKWIGDWETNGSVFHPELRLSQKKNRLSGTFSLESISIPIAGSVDGNLQMQWTAGSGSCSSLTGNGTADNMSANEINGTIELVDCVGNNRFDGPVVWRRSSKLSTEFPASAHSTLEDLVALLKKGTR